MRLAQGKQLLICTAVVVVLSGAVVVKAQKEEDYRLQTTSELVQLDVAVENSHGPRVPGLLKDAFKVHEDGKIQTLSFFAQEDLPVSIGIVVDQLLNLPVGQGLAWLRLPRQHALRGHSFVEDVVRLLLAEGDEEDEISGSIGNGYDALESPRSGLWREGRTRIEDPVDLLARVVLESLESRGHGSRSLA